ncbi:heterokaryon incompatibility protein-domain-containing protein [Xylaria digitata]|nr:heterokaryon incompatibility protein-domain-containing protein [Xylaria digitata]
MPLAKKDHLTGSCSICAGYVRQGKLDFDDQNEIAPNVAHQNCPECDEFEADKSQLCSFCSHIRPSHLLTCGYVRDLFDGQFDIVLGTPAELHLRQEECAFCRWCLRIAQADSRLRQYTINEGKPIYIMRRINIEKLDRSRGNTASVDWQTEIILYITSKASCFIQNSVNPQYVKLGHNKISRWALPATNSATSTKPNFANLKTFSVAPPSVEWAVARRWKAVCEKEHRACCEKGTGKLPKNFRLVDVELESVVDAHIEPYLPFVSLSYVWGTDLSNEITARRDNISFLKQPGSLRHLPRTITHAMEVCKRLGERYLWVDRLCIVQDDKKDKYGQIRSLEAIYSRANLVIVAACGDSMHSGLTGIHDEFARDTHQIPTTIFGFTMANKLNDFGKATQSTWNERGWTYQEAVLARRKLYFTPAEIWFECVEGVQRENTFSADRASQKPLGNCLRVPDSSGTSLISDNYEDYRRHIEHYSRRILTYPSDVYHAFNGIENAFYSEGGTIFGLPESDFSRALLWYPYDWPNLQERRPGDEDVILPSWSWASLIGHIATCRLYGSRHSTIRQRGSFYCSLCEWTTWNGEHSQQSTRKINAINDEIVWTRLDQIWAEQDPTAEPHFDNFLDVPDYRQFLALAWAKGCIEADVPTDLLVSPTDPAMSAEELASRWPTVGAFWAEVRRRISDTQDPSIPPSLHPGHLLTRTQWSVLRVEHDGDKEHLRGDIYVPNTHFLIRHTQSGEKVGALLSTVEYRLRSIATPDQAADVDFIALAVGSMPACVSGEVDEESLKKNCFHMDRPEDLLRFAQPGILIMAVRWNGAIARRVALGWVTLQGWVDSKPSFRTVVLA